MTAVEHLPQSLDGVRSRTITCDNWPLVELSALPWMTVDVPIRTTAAPPDGRAATRTGDAGAGPVWPPAAETVAVAIRIPSTSSQRADAPAL